MALAAKALAGGGELRSPTRVHWNIAGFCQSPVHRELWARPSGKRGRYRPEKWSPVSGKPYLGGWRPYQSKWHETAFDGQGRRTTKALMVVELETRCRKCDRCRAHKSRAWAARALTELGDASRTWFGTITFNPTAMARGRARAILACSKSGIDFDALPVGEQVVRVHNALSPELTKWLKRVRKNSGAHIRYLMVMEPHTGGGAHHQLPHYHILLHEHGHAAVTKRCLDGNWHLGITHFRLVAEDDPRPARYVTKYISKTTAARVRASVGYGKTILDGSCAEGLNPRHSVTKKRPPRQTLRDTEGLNAPEWSQSGSREREYRELPAVLTEVQVGTCSHEHVSNVFGGEGEAITDGSAGAPPGRLSNAEGSPYARRAAWFADAVAAIFAARPPDPGPAGLAERLEAAWQSGAGAWDRATRIRRLQSLANRPTGRVEHSEQLCGAVPVLDLPRRRGSGLD